ncbi:MAG: hypothetical protein HYY29_00590 [Chloroflexi bacterium]|nr:hypothetical protein [Chloroflexota bacterium]
MPGGYYRPGSEYNWYAYAGNDPINFADSSGYQYSETQKQIIGPVSILVGTGLYIVGVTFLVVGVVTFNVELIPAGLAFAAGGLYITSAGFKWIEGGNPARDRPANPQIGPFKIPRR